MPDKPLFEMHFEALPGDRPVIIRLRFLLRRMLRSLGFRCLRIVETTPAGERRDERRTPQPRGAEMNEQHVATMQRIESKRPLKLFVVGETEGDPETWSEWGSRAFVIAGSAQEAISRVDFGAEAAEVSFNKAAVLCSDESSRIDTL
jgi:hypothetical protein